MKSSEPASHPRTAISLAALEFMDRATEDDNRGRGGADDRSGWAVS